MFPLSTSESLHEVTTDNFLVESVDLADHFHAEFTQMYDEALFGRHKEDVNGTDSVSFRGDEVRFLFSPEHDPVHDLVAEINAAEHSLRFMVFSYTHPDVSDAMIDAFNRGVDVVGIFDESQGRGYYSKDETLAAAGIPVYIDGNHNASGFSGGKLHHKVLLVDAGYSDTPTVVTGSFNWSKSGTLYNDENLLLARDPGLVELYRREFCDRLAEATIHEAYFGPIPSPCEDPLDKVFINEFHPDPDGTDRGSEFVEILNGSTTTVDLTGWTFGDATNSQRHVFDGTLLGPGDGLVLYDTGDHSDIVNALTSSTGYLSLNNSGDTLSLVDPLGIVVDSVEYSRSDSGVSWNRDPDGSLHGDWTWHDEMVDAIDALSPGTLVDGSPFVSDPPEAHLLINELLPNPSGTDTGQEFVEIVNVGEVEVELDGWSLGDLQNTTRHEFTTEVLLPGEALVVYDRGDHSEIPGWVLSSSTYLSLTNTGDAVTLYDDLGDIHDQVVYSGSSNGISLNRDPDLTAGAEMIDHDLVSPTAEAMSPGYHADGSSFGE